MWTSFDNTSKFIINAEIILLHKPMFLKLSLNSEIILYSKLLGVTPFVANPIPAIVNYKAKTVRVPPKPTFQ